MANGNAVGDFARSRSGNTPVDVIVNAVDLIDPLSAEERIALRHQLVEDVDRPLILSVGRLTPAKGFFDLLSAFKIIHSTHPRAALVIAGGGDLRDDLIKLVDEFGLHNDVFLLGSRHDVPKILAAADIYVNSSLWEGTPVSVLEAMSAGLPIVATTVGENPYLLSLGKGILVPPSEPEKIASAIISLLDSPQMCIELGRAARLSIQENHGRNSWRRNILTLYAKILPEANEYLEKLDDNYLDTLGPGSI
jgi:glycosyltransferase involved in cell wall biosynthesis